MEIRKILFGARCARFGDPIPACAGMTRIKDSCKKIMNDNPGSSPPLEGCPQDGVVRVFVIMHLNFAFSYHLPAAPYSSNGGELSVIPAFLPCHSCVGRNRVYTVRSETEPNLPLPRHLRATPSLAKGINPPHKGVR